MTEPGGPEAGQEGAHRLGEAKTCRDRVERAGWLEACHQLHDLGHDLGDMVRAGAQSIADDSVVEGGD
jgi:hypothetical protein